MYRGSWFLDTPREIKFGMQNRVALEIGGKITMFSTEGENFCYEFSEGSKKREFMKSKFHV